MGSRPTLGHMPEIYSLMSDEELIREYENYLLPRLALSGETFKPQPSQLDVLRRENVELRERLLKLTELLAEREPRGSLPLPLSPSKAERLSKASEAEITPNG